MQMFGLISILVTVGFVAWWFTASVGPTQPTQDENGVAQESTYEDAIHAAEDLVEQVEVRDSISLSSRTIPVYDGINIPDDVRVLDLSGKGLTGSLKAEVRQLVNLRELDISDNNFTGLPAEVGQLSKLEVLNLADNPLTGLPHELGNLQNLRVLDLRGTQYSEFDLGIIQGQLPASTQILID